MWNININRENSFKFIFIGTIPLSTEEKQLCIHRIKRKTTLTLSWWVALLKWLHAEILAFRESHVLVHT